MVKTNFCSIKVLLVTTLALIVILIGILVLSFVGIPLIIDDQVAKQLRLDEGTIQWDRFVELPITFVFKVNIFNITNAGDVLKGDTPILQEVGPYCYTQTRKKNILGLNSTEDTVTFEQNMDMTFNQSLSGDLKETDRVVVVNPAMLVLTQITTAIERFVVVGCLDKIFPAKYNKLFIEVDVGSLIFGGIEFASDAEDIGVACNIVRSLVLEKTKIMRNVKRIPSKTDPNVISSLAFSFLEFKTRAPDGIYTTIRGRDDISKLGSIIRWNNSAMLPYWGRTQSINNETCQAVRGTDSTLYPPHITKSGTFEIFNTDICRVVEITYKYTSSYMGLDGYRFGISENTLRSTTPDPENDCYCIKQTADSQGNPNCYMDGILDVMPCFGIPILLSLPHFLYADEKYIKEIKGVSAPVPSDHEIYLLVEPNTGTPLEGMKRVQLNVVLRPVKFIDFTEKLPRLTLPLVWIEEGVSLTPELISELKDKFFDKVNMADGIKYGLIAVTTAGIFVSSGFLMRKHFWVS